MFDFFFKKALETKKMMEDEAHKHGARTWNDVITNIENQLTAIRQDLDSINKKLDK